MLWLWIALIVAFLVIEAVTVQLVTIWFTVGAIGALIANVMHTEIWVQVLVFVAVSAITLLLTRPFVKRFTEQHKVPTNADRYIGKQAVVVEPIDNIHAKGAVTVGGLEWTARTKDGSNIEKDEIVTIESIEGAKLIVKK
ncbi:MAG: NfeD family protein [Acutalibacteraceae bacterium]|nr:NfeD family protein [Acutalibacteraceae bacterium]